MIRTIRSAGPSLFAIGIFLALGSPFLFPQKAPRWWKIEVELATTGEYAYREGNVDYGGSYSLETLWSGTMERDDMDYLLYHAGWELRRWEVKEKACFPEKTIHLTEQAIADRPFFQMNYILRNEDDLEIDFVVKGISIPLNKSSAKGYLVLPSSKDSHQTGPEVSYDTYLSEGSNRVAFPEKAIYGRPMKKEFSWAWNNRGWVLKETKTVYIADRHEAKLKVVITPQY